MLTLQKDRLNKNQKVSFVATPTNTKETKNKTKRTNPNMDKKRK